MEISVALKKQCSKKNAPSLKNSKGVSFLLKERNIFNNCRDGNLRQSLIELFVVGWVEQFVFDQLDMVKFNEITVLFQKTL